MGEKLDGEREEEQGEDGELGGSGSSATLPPSISLDPPDPPQWTSGHLEVIREPGGAAGRRRRQEGSSWLRRSSLQLHQRPIQPRIRTLIWVLILELKLLIYGSHLSH